MYDTAPCFSILCKGVQGQEAILAGIDFTWAIFTRTMLSEKKNNIYVNDSALPSRPEVVCLITASAAGMGTQILSSTVATTFLTAKLSLHITQWWPHSCCWCSHTGCWGPAQCHYKCAHQTWSGTSGVLWATVWSILVCRWSLDKRHPCWKQTQELKQIALIDEIENNALDWGISVLLMRIINDSQALLKV